MHRATLSKALLNATKALTAHHHTDGLAFNKLELFYDSVWIRFGLGAD